MRVIWFKEQYGFGSWFFIELYKEGFHSLFLKCLMFVTCLKCLMFETFFFRPSFNIEYQGAKRQKSFMSKSVSIKVLGLKLVKLNYIFI